MDRASYAHRMSTLKTLSKPNLFHCLGDSKTPMFYCSQETIFVVASAKFTNSRHKRRLLTCSKKRPHIRQSMLPFRYSPSFSYFWYQSSFQNSHNNHDTFLSNYPLKSLISSVYATSEQVAALTRQTYAYFLNCWEWYCRSLLKLSRKENVFRLFYHSAKQNVFSKVRSFDIVCLNKKHLLVQSNLRENVVIVAVTLLDFSFYRIFWSGGKHLKNSKKLNKHLYIQIWLACFLWIDQDPARTYLYFSSSKERGELRQYPSTFS